MDKKEVGAYSWVARGSLRRAVLKALDKPRIVSDVYKEAKKHNPLISLNNTSDTLRAFEEKKIAICINPKERVGRICNLTLIGEKVSKEIE